MQERLRSSLYLALGLAATVALGACRNDNNRADTTTAGGAVTDTGAMSGTSGGMSSDSARRDSAGMSGRQGTDTSRSGRRTP